VAKPKQKHLLAGQPTIHRRDPVCFVSLTAPSYPPSAHPVRRSGSCSAQLLLRTL
jgi:hypothetical protein